MRIGCDLDGTLADMTGALSREAKALFGIALEVHRDVPLPPESRTEPEPPLDLDAMDGDAANAPGRVRTEGRAKAAAAIERAIVEENPDPDDAAMAVMDEVSASDAAARPLTESTDADVHEDDEGLRLTPSQQQKLWRRVRDIENFWTTLSEIEPGAVAQLGRHASEHAWEVLFLTQRPPSVGEPSQLQSQRWLAAHGFNYPSVFVVGADSRGRIADVLHLDIVIDDRPENCLDVALESRALPILVWRDDPAVLPPAVRRYGIEVVQSISQAFRIARQVQEGRRSPRKRIVSSIKKALGIGE